jgi:hypothetical protein
MKLKGLAGVLVMAALVGCTLTRTELRPGAGGLMNGLSGGGEGGKLLVPRQCVLRMAIVARPSTEPTVADAIWRVADVQAVGDEARRCLEANGMRVGIVTGDLPPEVRAVFAAPPPNRIEPSTVVLPDGNGTLVDLAASRPELDLLLNRPGGVAGKRYKEANGYLRISASRQDDSGVALRIVPEVHHGPVRQGWGVAPGVGGALAPQQMVMHSGQQEESFRELAATLTVHAGQVAVIGALPEKRGSLGHFLYTAVEANSDREVHKLLFVWAARSEDAPSALAPPALLPADPPESGESSRRPASRAARPGANPPR